MPLRKQTIHALIVGTLLALFGSSAFAQTNNSMNEMLERIGSQKGKGFDRSPVGKPSSAAVNLNVHWRMWKRVYAEGQAGEEQLASLVQDGRSLGRLNQPQYAMAVAALSVGFEDYDVASTALEGAEALAPELPYPYLLHAAYVLENDPARLPHWVKPWWKGVSAGALWPDTSYPWMLKLLSYLLLGLGFGSLVFMLGQLLRNFSVVAYDLTRVLPKGFSANQTALILVAGVAVPGLLTKSVLVSLLVLLGITTVSQRHNERWISLVVFGFLASLPYAEDALSRLATYPKSNGQEIFQAQWIDCDAGCRESMDGLAQAHPEDPYIRYTALLAAYRAGGDANLQRVVEEVDSVDWPGNVIGFAHNLKGAAQVALANPKQGLETLQLASDQQLAHAAPAFNMMRAHQMLGEEAEAANSLEEAGARQLETVAVYLDLDRRDVNSFLIVEPLPLRQLIQYHFKNPDPERKAAVIEPLWNIVAGKQVTFDKAPLLGAIGLALVFLGFALRRHTSTPCPRCGQARDPSETQNTGDHAYCVPCYGTFVMGATLDYETRVHNEKVLGRRESFQRVLRRFSGLAIPGLGHHVAGYAITGFLLTTFITFCVAVVLHPHGPIRAPHELVGVNWTGQVTIGWIIISICVFTLINAAMRDLEPVGLHRGGGER